MPISGAVRWPAITRWPPPYPPTPRPLTRACRAPPWRTPLAALVGDDHHHECVELFTGLHLAGRRLLVRGTVVAEVGYLLARESGARSESLFLTALADGDFELVDLRQEDYRRAAELVTTLTDLPLETTDATVVALAERLGVREVATLDRRHFTVVRPAHVTTLTLLP